MLRYLLDTGAQENLIRPDTLSNAGAVNIDRNYITKMKGFNDMETSSDGSIIIPLMIGQYRYKLKIYIIENLCVQEIIGSPSLALNWPA